jgi:putative Holliday junction resolvase
LPRILAVDWGERRIGLAVSDALGILATGLPTLEIRGEAEAVARVADTIRTVEADSVVVGLPLTLKGERGEAARAVERFAEALRRETPVVVSRKGRVDQGAAVALLEGWLAKLRIEREGDAT